MLPRRRVITDSVSREDKAIGGVRLFVCPFVTTLSFEPTTFEPEFMDVCGSWPSRLGLRVKVIGRGQRSMSSAYGRGNAVT